LDVETSIATVTRDVKLAYFAALASEAAIRVAEDTVETRKRYVDQAQAFFKVGTKTKIDVASAESDLAAAVLARARAVGDVARARAQLWAVIGEETLRSDMLIVPAEAPELDVSKEGALIDDALAARNEVKAFEMRQRSFDDAVRSTKAAFAPELRLNLGPSWAGIDLSNMTTNFALTATIAFPTGGWNLLNLHANLRQARANAEVNRAAEAVQRQSVRLDVAQAVADYDSARQAIPASIELVRAAQERRDLADGRYRAGIGSILELSDADLQYANARLQDVQSRLNLAQARARLEWALGRH
jgi:outer membrane protein